jgi:hypothetical protein
MADRKKLCFVGVGLVPTLFLLKKPNHDDEEHEEKLLKTFVPFVIVVKFLNTLSCQH